MSEVGIKEPEKLISPILGGNKKVTDVKISRLTEPGENNLSLVLKVDYVIENGNGTKEELYGVAKVKPIGDFVFGHQQNYKNELAFYNIVVPTLQDFQRQQGVDDVMDIFAKLHAFRPNFHGKNDEIDDDSVIMLENLIELGYENIDRLVGFDLELTKLILKDLALLHGVPLALRRLQPEVYREKNRI
ncbi:hypothetical protein NQ318_000152 [Aromia moschata]|uniref:Uncharacterized protein n=1 Tax=Aromia moschata TaxID=1265417 RepID=A0AAV8XCR8_9CUCU|nr:hypothetical protein NQ318_000152 [Aromia moschata]